MEKKKVLLGTHNKGKIREIMEVMGELDLQFVFPGDLNLNEDLEEDGQTYEENAYKKANHFYQQCQLVTLAEDSGIQVDALNGQLGVKTRRWGAGEKATDQEWIDYFLEKMADVPDEQRIARFICTSALIDHDGVPHLFRAQTEGVIMRELQAPIIPGLPLSSCFRPVGFDKVYAALTTEEKNLISHRGKNMKQVKDCLLRYILN